MAESAMSIHEHSVCTGVGYISVLEYLNIRAVKAGYGSYKAAFENGFRVRGYENVEPKH